MTREVGLWLNLSKKNGATWMAQWVEHPTVGFNSGSDLMCQEIKPCISLHQPLHSVDSLLEIVSLSLCPSPYSHVHALPLSKINL